MRKKRDSRKQLREQAGFAKMAEVMMDTYRITETPRWPAYPSLHEPWHIEYIPPEPTRWQRFVRWLKSFNGHE